MTKPTTEELALALETVASLTAYEEEVPESANLVTRAIRQAAERLRELERENAEARKLAEEWRKRAHNPPGGQTFVYQDVLFPWEEA